MTDDDIVEAMARGICRERCAFMGEPACWQLDDADGGPYPFPAEGCGDVNCVDMARAAIRACHDAGGLVLREVPGVVTPADAPREAILPTNADYRRGWATGYNAAIFAARAAAVEGG